MNNKKLGNAFEREMCDILRSEGYWVHFISPNSSGAQPFDIIAVKAGRAIAIDCKTCADDSFPLSRLEDNQMLAFDHWISCGNEDPYIAVKHNGAVYMISYKRLKGLGRIKLTEKYLRKVLT